MIASEGKIVIVDERQVTRRFIEQGSKDGIKMSDLTTTGRELFLTASVFIFRPSAEAWVQHKHLAQYKRGYIMKTRW
ncbi:hypothetical protein Molly5_1 [Maribacter phage Molly_5]|uniref:Uncharacterized protein n=1 Tax=Maribacter phage Molly_1 TaxID=2745685 RepID=A0A8E4UY57_9CAUD|nr:hypothetical protein M1M29_gp001 [Maribacter phage Molly_1]QQO97588.1 hypothetical protein Molly2_1 [Maribacter phage Molly_2]QQO97788.1 hypothetical protein Molly3_1 [Maribacter phage Molly_3]QQO97988.1 hypothetical protein Molly4_1 [Maribacter phage Molly_4]QQO98188.1 hypothetical protein Molly5_1 [Maribacter phage Molly_5]QQO97388.1 hypothetical protein Molly1_1 [Maribacter phage Molly_1]